MKIKNVSVLILVTALTGCVTEQPATGPALTNLQETCTAYGFKAGTEAFNACVFQLDQQRMANARDKRMAVADSLGQIGAGMQANAGRQSNCTYRRIGNTVQQDCY